MCVCVCVCVYTYVYTYIYYMYTYIYMQGVHAVGQCIGVSLELERFGATWDVQHKHMLQAIRAALAQQVRHTCTPSSLPSSLPPCPLSLLLPSL